jgi:hypothetical protein
MAEIAVELEIARLDSARGQCLDGIARDLWREQRVIAIDNMMWGSDHPRSESTFPRSREIPAGVPEDQQAKPAPDPDPGIAGGNTARLYNFDVARLAVPA